MSSTARTFQWTHVCSLANWTTVWIQNADRCPCGKRRPS